MNVIVWGENHHNALGLVRSLGEVGHNVYLLLYKVRLNYVAKSRYVKKCVYLDKDSDVISIIKTISQNLEDKPALLVTGDPIASFVDSHLNEINQYAITEGGFQTNDINKYRDKHVSNALAAEIGFNVPKSWVLQNGDSYDVDFIFPIILKEACSLPGSKKVLAVINSMTELKDHLAELEDSCYPLIVQQFINKDYEIMLQGCSLNHGETIVSKVANRRIRVYPEIYGGASYSSSVNIDEDDELVEIRDMVLDFMRRVGYSGLFSAEFLYKDGKYYFQEVNFRNDGTSYLSTSCGVNLPDIYCHSLKRQEIKEGTYKKSIYINVFSDYHHVSFHKLLFKDWIKDVITANCYSHFNWKDPIPYLYYLPGALKYYSNTK